MATRQSRGLLLFADDDPDIRRSVAELLMEEGFEVMAFPDGGEALEWLQTSDRKPDLILLDWTMPIVSGEQFLDVLREHEGAKMIPVIVLTASMQIPPKVRRIAKPFTVETLLNAIEDLMAPQVTPAGGTEP